MGLLHAPKRCRHGGGKKPVEIFTYSRSGFNLFLGSSFFLLRSTLEEENSPCNRSFDGGSRSGSRDRFVEVSGASPWFSHWFSGSWFFFLSWFSVAGGSRWFSVSPSLHRDNSSNVSLFGKYGDNRATLASIWICIVVIMVDDEMREAFLSHCFAV